MTREKAIEILLDVMGTRPRLGSREDHRPFATDIVIALGALGLIKFEEPVPLEDQSFLVAIGDAKSCATVSGATIINALRRAGYRVERNQ